MVAQRIEGRIRLQRLAVTLLLKQLDVVPMSLSLPETPDEVLVLGMLTHWQKHCQVSLSSACLCLELLPKLCLHQAAVGFLPLVVLQATQSYDIAQEQQRHRAIMYKVYSRRAAALQKAALTAWHAATAAAQEKAAALRALTLRSKQRRLQGMLDKSAPDAHHVLSCLSGRPPSLLHRATKMCPLPELVGTQEIDGACRKRSVVSTGLTRAMLVQVARGS